MTGLPSSPMYARRAVALLLLAVLSGSLATPAAAQTPPRQVRMTWFGITNWHYQIGDLGIMLDGAVSFRSEGLGKQQINKEIVDKVHDALKKEGSIDVILLGHKHDDHSLDSPYWALKTKARYFAPAEA